MDYFATALGFALDLALGLVTFLAAALAARGLAAALRFGLAGAAGVLSALTARSQCS